MNRRKKACEAYSHDPLMVTCLDFLNKIPWDVHSGDESAHEGGRNQYAITTMVWRAPILRQIFQILDRIYLSTRFTSDNRATRGAFLHTRFPSRRQDPRGPPSAALPVNIYSQQYLQDLPDYAVVNLPKSHSVTIAFSPAMLQ